MHLSNLHIVNFKNYEQATLHFSPRINCFVGNNGSGKTNLLDAIHYLSLCKSFFTPIDSQNIKHNEAFFVLSGEFLHKEQNNTIYCGVKRNQKKQFKRNQKEYEKLADHVGQFPSIMITPEDSALISDGSELRRKFIDNTLSQTNRDYLSTLIAYNKALLNRNALLKTFAEQKNSDPELLDLWNEQLLPLGEKIFKLRHSFVQAISETFVAMYQLISGASEVAGLAYESALHQHSFKNLLEKSAKKDMALQYTSAGTHRDDLQFLLNAYPIKKYGSQGQQKSYLLALRLAQYEYLKNATNCKPLLMLDDIFDKLDKSRVQALIHLLGGEQFGQVFITDTSTERLNEILTQINSEKQLFEVENGIVKPLNI